MQNRARTSALHATLCARSARRTLHPTNQEFAYASPGSSRLVQAVPHATHYVRFVTRTLAAASARRTQAQTPQTAAASLAISSTTKLASIAVTLCVRIADYKMGEKFARNARALQVLKV
jgi:hypothetical protein